MLVAPKTYGVTVAPSTRWIALQPITEDLKKPSPLRVG